MINSAIVVRTPGDILRSGSESTASGVMRSLSRSGRIKIGSRRSCLSRRRPGRREKL